MLGTALLGGCTTVASDGDAGAMDDGATDTDASPQPLDLFACDFPTSCEPITEHTKDVDPPGAAECATRLAIDGEPGVVLHTAQLGGSGISETQRILVFLADGTAIVQQRVRQCDSFGDPGCTNEDPPPWELADEHLQCDVSVDPEIVEACGCEPGDDNDACDIACFTTSWIDGCVPTEPYSCEALSAVLAGG